MSAEVEDDKENKANTSSEREKRHNSNMGVVFESVSRLPGASQTAPTWQGSSGDHLSIVFYVLAWNAIIAIRPAGA